MSVHNCVDVLIIGAGPTGLTLACDLARRGVPHRIIEREAAASTASRAKTVQPRALEVLQDLGAARALLERGLVDLPVRFHGPGGADRDAPGLAVRAGGEFRTPFPDPVWIGEPEVEAALRAQHARSGGGVELGTEAVGLTQDEDEDEVRVEVATPQGREVIGARYVVGADGGRSRTRSWAGLPLVGETYDRQRWYLGDVVTDGLDRSRVHIWPSDQGMLGLTPLPGTGAWQLQAPIPADVEDPPAPSLELYQAMLDDRAGEGVVRLAEASWLSIYRVNVRMVPSYRSGRVFLAGDAAHVHSPAGGQGMNTGIQDAYNLGWKLAAVLGGAAPSLLDTYSEERVPVALAVLGDSTQKMHQTLAATEDTAGRLSAALGALSDDLTSGLPVAYPTSSLTLPGSGGSLPMPGHRAPDAAGLRGQGFRGSLHDLLQGAQWTLLAFTDGEGPRLSGVARELVHVHRIGTTTVTAIEDSRGEAHRAYRPQPGELVLVRPDGYLAARVPASEEQRLVDYLTQLLPDPPPRHRETLDALSVRRTLVDR